MRSYAQNRPGPRRAADEDRYGFSMVKDAISRLNTPPRELLMDLIDLSPATWQSRTLAAVNEKIKHSSCPCAPDDDAESENRCRQR